MTRLIGLAWLVVLWCLLWREASPANILSGLTVAAVLSVLFPSRAPEGTRRAHRIRPAALAHLVGYFMWKMLEANVLLAREILTREDRSRRGVIAVPVAGYSDTVVTIAANLITLTPGTVTLEVRADPPELYVHVLHLYDIDRARADIQRLEELVERAFGVDRRLEAQS